MDEVFDYQDQKEESNFNLKAELYKYLTHWKWMLLSILIGCGIAYLYNRYTVPKYRSEASLMILKDEGSSISGVLGGGGASFLKLEDNSLENQIINLRSKRLVRKVVDDLDHNISYFNEGNIITTETYKSSPVIIEFITPDSIVNNISKNFIITPISSNKFKLSNLDSRSLGEYQFGDIVTLDGLKFSIVLRNDKKDKIQDSSPIHIVLTPIDNVVREYIDKSTINSRGRGVDILSLSTINKVSEKGEDFLNNLMVQFNKDGVIDKRQVAIKTTEFIQNRLEIITSELDSVETGIADFKRGNEIMDVNSGAQFSLSKKNVAEEQLYELETQIELVMSLREEILGTNKFELLPVNVGLEPGLVTGEIANYNQLIIERNDLLRNGTTENPIIKDLEYKINVLRDNLVVNINELIQNLNRKLDNLDRREESFSNRFSAFPGMEKGMRSISRQQEIKERLYLFLLQRREDAAIAFAVTSPVAKVIDSAFTHTSPVSPQPWMVLAGGFIIGLFIPILIIFVKNFLDTKVHHKGDLSPLLKVIPFIGEIPKIESDSDDVIHVNDRSPLAESFRILRTNLAYLIQNKDKAVGDVIFVTSTIKGEGKTFVSYNLARTLASTSKKVLLVGADIRNPKLHRYTEATQGMKEKGLSDYLYDYEVEFDDVVSKTADDGIPVDVILSGPIPPNPAELLMNDRMESLIALAKKKYSYIITDTAPSMIVTDTLLISPLADYTLYVTRADFTEKNLLDFPKDLKKQGKLKGLALILNDVDYSKFSYGAQYGYSYGYGYGYGGENLTRWQRIKRRLFS